MPPDLENLEELGFGLAKAIRQQSGEHYEVTSACEGTGFAGFQGAGGSMMDFFYADYRVPYAYQIKLRDTGSYGFLLPKENIIPAGEESLAALKHFGQFILDDGSPVERQEVRQEKELK
jgi:extracellular matrix protein 14